MQGWQTNGSILSTHAAFSRDSFVRVGRAMFSLNITRSPIRSVMSIHTQIANNSFTSTTKLNYAEIRRVSDAFAQHTRTNIL